MRDHLEYITWLLIIAVILVVSDEALESRKRLARVEDGVNKLRESVLAERQQPPRLWHGSSEYTYPVYEFRSGGLVASGPQLLALPTGTTVMEVK